MWLIGEKVDAFGVHTTCIMDGVQATRNTCRVRDIRVEVDRVVIGVNASRTLQLKIFLRDDGDARWMYWMWSGSLHLGTM